MHRSVKGFTISALSLVAGLATSALFFLTPLVDLVMRPIMAAAAIVIPAGWARPLRALWPEHDIEIVYALVLVILPAMGLGPILGAVLVLCLRAGARVRPLLVGFVGPALLLAAWVSLRLVLFAQVSPLPLEYWWDRVWKLPFAMTGGSYAIACLLAWVAVRRWRRVAQGADAQG